MAVTYGRLRGAMSAAQGVAVPLVAKDTTYRTNVGVIRGEVTFSQLRACSALASSWQLGWERTTLPLRRLTPPTSFRFSLSQLQLPVPGLGPPRRAAPGPPEHVSILQRGIAGFRANQWSARRNAPAALMGLSRKTRGEWTAARCAAWRAAHGGAK
jgi:hypothetical protein